MTGNASNAATFGGSSLANGDIVIVNTGITLTFDAAYNLGSNASGIGDALVINATDQTTFGKVIVNDGVTLTLQGFGTASNRAMICNRYAQFAPAPGAIVSVDCASQHQTVLDIRGIINAIGTAPKPVRFISPAANYSWNNDIVAESFSGTAWKFDSAVNVACVAFTNDWLANAAGTGLGVVGNTSVSFGGTNAAAFGTERASLSLVTASGDYFIDYVIGVVYFYWTPASGNPAFTKTYKYLTNTKGWGIVASQSNTYNEAKFDYCSFEYMGGSTAADTRTLDIQNKQSAAVAANRLFYCTNSTFSYCYRPIGLKACTGTSGDPLLITGNTFLSRGDGTFGGVLSGYRSASTYVKLDSNTIRARNDGGAIFVTTFGSVLDFTGWTITNNAHSGSAFATALALTTRFPGTTISGNTFEGVGSSVDYRTIASLGGSSGNPLTITGNTLRRVKRSLHYSSYIEITKNIFDRSFHHGVVGPIEDDLQITGVNIENNLFIGESTGYDDTPSIEAGYNHRHHIDNFKVVNNTLVGNPGGIFGFGDQIDTNTFTTCSRLVVVNNIGKMTTAGASKAWRRFTIDSTHVWKGHVLQFDYNLDHNYTTRYTGLNRQGTFVKGGTNYNTQTVSTRNIPGVALFDPNFSSASGKTLDFTYTSVLNQTITFDGGTAKQLVIAPGGTSTNALTGAANNSTNGVAGAYSGTLTDTLAAFNTTKGNAACPSQNWVKITSGAGSGQIRCITNNTATVLTVVPAWTTIPTAADTYVILDSEVSLVDGADTVKAGIYWPDMPTATAQDTGIDFADHSVTGSDPLLVNAAGTAAADYKIGASSPAKDVATADYAPAADYFATARPQGAADDIGAHELAAAFKAYWHRPERQVIGGGMR